MKHLVIISGNDSSLPKVRPPETKISMIQTRDRSTAWQRKFVDVFIEVDEIESESLLEILTRLDSEQSITGLVCFLEPVILTAAQVADALGIRSNPVNAVATARDKSATRRALERAGIPQRPWNICRTADEVIAFHRDLGEESIVIKPLTGAGSAGVRKVRTNQEIREHLAEIRGLHKWALIDNQDFLVLAEAILPGEEFSVEAMSVDGVHEIVQITGKITSGPPRFVELGHWQPAKVGDLQKAAIEQRVVEILDAIGHETGPSHTEVMVDGMDVWLVETHTRFGGDQIWELTELTTGRHMATETIFSILDLPMPNPGLMHPEAAIAFMTWASQSELPSKPEIIHVKYPSSTEPVAEDEIYDSSSRSGYVLSAGLGALSICFSAVKTLQNRKYYV